MKYFCFGFCLFSILYGSNSQAYAGHVTIETHMEYSKEDRKQGWLRKHCEKIDAVCTQEYDGKMFVQPRYPMSMLRIGMRAICVADVSLDEFGKIEKVKEIVCNPDKEEFKHSILKVINRFDFHPRIVDGIPEKVGNVLLKFNYSIVQ